MAAVDTVRALYIFARFSDALDPEPECSGDDAWPDSLVLAPAWGEQLLEAGGPPSLDSSLTTYFYTMSNGKHLLIGDVYDSVVTVNKTLSWFRNNFSSEGVRQRAAMDTVLSQVDADTTVSFTDYDHDGNGDVDMVFIQFRSRSDCTGCFPLGTAGGEAHRHTPDRPFWVETDGNDSLRVVTSCSVTPSVMSRRAWYTIEIAAHEYGHHVEPSTLINPTTTELAGSGHRGAMGRYDLMQGNRNANAVPAYMSTWSRWRLGWITPVDTIPFTPGAVHDVRLADVGTSPDSGFVVIETASPWQWFLVEARDSTATLYTSGLGVPCTGTCPDTVLCTPTPFPSGLLITHVAELGHDGHPGEVIGYWNSPLCPAPVRRNETQPPFLSVEVASGKFDLGTGDMDPVGGFDAISECSDNTGSDDDFFRPGMAFGPHTNPNTNLYPPSGTSQDQSVPSGIAVSEISWDVAPGGGGGRIRFTVGIDSSAANGGPYVLPDSTTWSGDVQLAGDVRVAAGRTLLLEDDARVIVSARRDGLATGADPEAIEIVLDGTLVVAAIPDSAEITSSRDSTFVHFAGVSPGSFGYASGGTVSGASADAAAADWFGITVGEAQDPETAFDNVDFLRLKHAATALALSSDAIPDLTHGPNAALQFEDNLLDVAFDRDVVV